MNGSNPTDAIVVDATWKKWPMQFTVFNPCHARPLRFNNGVRFVTRPKMTKQRGTTQKNDAVMP